MVTPPSKLFYELLIRGRADGSMAAHIIHAKPFTDADGNTVFIPGDAEDLDLSNLPQVQAIIGDAVGFAVAAQNAAMAEAEQLRSEIVKHAEALEEAERQAAAANERHDAAVARAVRAEDALAQATSSSEEETAGEPERKDPAGGEPR